MKIVLVVDDLKKEIKSILFLFEGNNKKNA